MPKRKKPKVFRAVKAVKAAAREQMGSPPPTRTVPDRKKEQRREKHKPTLGELLEDG
ncbi:MAG TPA: hypothetical protein VEV41_14870 [Terriglobales bacterium]|nr:hypothetical protein [Terriglobales bacterium]